MPERGAPVWGYHDLALFLSAVLPSLARWRWSSLRITRMVAPALFASDAARTLVFQSFMYVFLVGALYLVIVVAVRRAFLSALGWTFPIPYGWLAAGGRAGADHRAFGVGSVAARAHGQFANRSV